MSKPQPYKTGLNTDNVVIYHSPCTDGMTAAWVMWEYFKQFDGVDVDFEDWSYSKGLPSPEILEGRDVWIVDFSFKYNDVLEIANFAETVIIFDHHKTAKDELEGRDWPPNVHVVFDMEQSGAGLAWRELFFGGDMSDKYGLDGPNPMPELVQYVEDRDLWKFELPKSRIINAYIREQEQTLQAWSELNAMFVLEPDAIEAYGEVIEDVYRKMAERHTRHASHISILGQDFLVTNVSDGKLFSRVGEGLAEHEEGFGTGGCWTLNSKHAIWGLRGREGVDVSETAKKFHGGGHPGASGFRIPLELHVALIRNAVFECDVLFGSDSMLYETWVLTDRGALLMGGVAVPFPADKEKLTIKWDDPRLLNLTIHRKHVFAVLRDR